MVVSSVLRCLRCALPRQEADEVIEVGDSPPAGTPDGLHLAHDPAVLDEKGWRQSEHERNDHGPTLTGDRLRGGRCALDEELARRFRLVHTDIVGREAELSWFATWLATPAPATHIVHINGPGGIGKSTLLDAFMAMAAAGGWPVVHLDGSAVEPTEEALRSALAELTGEPVGAAINERGAIVVIDTFERLSGTSRFLQDELLSGPHDRVRLVVAGRHRPGLQWAGWGGAMRRMELRGLSRVAARRLLSQRGVDEGVAANVIRVAGGHPLTLGLAADLVSQLGVEDVTALPDWKLTVRSLAQEILRDIGRPRVRLLLHAAAMVRHFDESVLAELLDEEDISDDFDQICRLSLVRATASGLRVHDDVRQLLAEDLRWRQPQTADRIVARALDRYRRDMAGADDDRRGWLSQEFMFAVLSPTARGTYFPLNQADLSAGPARPEDQVVLQDLRDSFTRAAPELAGTAPAEELVAPLLETAMATPSSFVRVAVDGDGRTVGYGFALPLGADTIGVLRADGPPRRLVDRYADDLPPLAADSDTYYLSTVVVGDAEAETVGGVLAVDGMNLLQRPGRYLAVTRSSPYVGALEAMGFESIGPVDRPGADDPLLGFVLDTSIVGTDGWLEARSQGRRPPRTLRGRRLTRELELVLGAFDDDEVLVESPLAEMAALDLGVADLPDGDAIRAMIRQCASGSATSPVGRHITAALARVDVPVPDRPSPPDRSAPATSPIELAVDPGVDPGAELDDAGAYDLRLLGAFELRRHGRQLELRFGIVARAIAAIALRGSIATDVLVELLWPDLGPGVGRNRLRNVLARMRAAGGSVVVRRGDALALADGVVVDVAEFEAAATAALDAAASGGVVQDLATRAADLYGGELLPAERYQTWAQAPRERLRARHLAVLDLLAGQAWSRHAVEEALAILESAIAIDPYDEERYLMAAAIMVEQGWHGRAVLLARRGRNAFDELGVAVPAELAAIERRH